MTEAVHSSTTICHTLLHYYLLKDLLCNLKIRNFYFEKCSSHKYALNNAFYYVNVHYFFNTPDIDIHVDNNHNNTFYL